MQGHYQISHFPIEREPVLHETGDFAVADYIVVSRRSRDRAGLRYQRRGVDEEAHVANFVESESIMRVEREGFINVFSYVQIRGSSVYFWPLPSDFMLMVALQSHCSGRKQGLVSSRRLFSVQSARMTRIWTH